MEVTIRPARAEDALVLAELRYALRATARHAPEPEPEYLARCARWMAAELARDGPWRSWVAADASTGVVVGCVWLQTVGKIPNPNEAPEELAYLSGFYLRAEYRGTGNGRAMLLAVLEWCDARVVDPTILWPTDRSRTLYERHGFGAATAILLRPSAIFAT